MDWVQVYDPLGSPVLSTLLAALPIIALLGLLAAGLEITARPWSTLSAAWVH